VGEDERLRLSPDGTANGLEHGDGESGGFTCARRSGDEIPALCYEENGTLLYRRVFQSLGKSHIKRRDTRGK